MVTAKDLGKQLAMQDLLRGEFVVGKGSICRRAANSRSLDHVCEFDVVEADVNADAFNRLDRSRDELFADIVER